jgi:hypothetical protein
MNNFFTNHLAFEILKYFPTKEIMLDGKTVIIPGVDTDNHFNGIGLHGVYDARFERIIITKLDYIPIDPNVKYDYVTKEFYVEELKNNVAFRTEVQLLDPEYFCNKSWSVSYNFNTQSWISFHSYLPNFYIGENNFFYSGVNGCCDDFDFIAGPLVPTPSTTTTTSSSTSSTTSTSTTAAPLDCTIAGTAIVKNCALEGTGITICVRPINLIQNNFATGYTILAGPTVVVSTGSQTDACNAITYINNNIETITVNTITVSYSSLVIGSTVYLGANTLTDCTLVPDGWYLTSESLDTGIVYHVVSGMITQIEGCFAPTTTTTTTAATCFSYTISKTTVGIVTVTFTDCSGNPGSRDVGNAEGGPSTQTFCARSGSVVTPPEVILTNNGPC